MEWLILVVAVPAILVPIVLIWGFAGCPSFGTAAPDPPSPPLSLKASGVSTSQIDLVWEHNSAGGVNFKVGRQRADGSWDDSHGSPGSNRKFSDTMLDERRSFNYRVTAVNPLDSSESSPSNESRTRTWRWETAYDQPLTDKGGNFAGACLVQRIDKALLSLNGQARRIRLTLRRSTAASLALERVYISAAAPATGIPGNVAPEPWDPDTDLTRIHDIDAGQPLLDVPAGTPKVLELDYALTKAKDLSVAFDIATGTSRRRRGGVGSSIGYLNTAADEAANPNRTSTAAQWEQRPPGENTVWLVEKIEALTSE